MGYGVVTTLLAELFKIYIQLCSKTTVNFEKYK